MTHDKDQLAATSFTYTGLSFGNSGRYAESITAYSESIRLVPDDVRIWSNRGYIFMAMGNLDAAVRNFEEGMAHVDVQLQLTEDPNISANLKAWYLDDAGHFLSNYANVLFRRGDNEESMRIADKGLSIKGIPSKYILQMKLHIHNAEVMIRRAKQGGQESLRN